MTTTVTTPDKGVNEAKARSYTHVEPTRFSKRIGSTTYMVAVHFSQSCKETMQDKVSRLIESEVRHIA